MLSKWDFCEVGSIAMVILLILIGGIIAISVDSEQLLVIGIMAIFISSVFLIWILGCFVFALSDYLAQRRERIRVRRGNFEEI